jgi:hypothetical protein
MRHRAPALLLDAIAAFTGDTLACTSRDTAEWSWPLVLEGAAQTAGLLAGLQEDGPGDAAVIAEYRDVVVHVAAAQGILRFMARLDRRLLDFWRCRVEARAADGTVLLDGVVTVTAGT